MLSEGGRAPLDDAVADRMLIVNVLHHVDDDPDALAEIGRLLAPGGLLVAAEFARMDRPVGPPNDHVLPLDDVRALLTGTGLDGARRVRAGLRRPVPQRDRRGEAAAVSAAHAGDAGAPRPAALRSSPTCAPTHGPGSTRRSSVSSSPSAAGPRSSSPGERIAVKINLLRAAPPEKAVTTHPETLGCVLRALKAAGAEPFVADSPGGPNGPAKVARAYKLSGIADVCAAEGVQIVDVEDDRAVLEAPEGRLYRSFPIGKAFVDADAIVQVGVLKTHQLMRLTGGVKLTYGVIPGLAKAHLHVKAQRREDFADMLLDLHLAVRPRFTIIDAIIAMEGQGPGSGTPRELDSLFAARDCRRARRGARRPHRPRAPRTSTPSPPRRAAGSSTSTTRTRSPATPSSRSPTFKPVRRDMQELLPPSLHRLARNLITARPRLVDPDACIRCNECAAICGTRAIAMDPLPDYDDAACVRCFACTEVCPTAAIDNVSPPLVRLFSRDADAAAAAARRARRLLVLLQPLEQRRLARRSPARACPRRRRAARRSGRPCGSAMRSSSPSRVALKGRLAAP